MTDYPTPTRYGRRVDLIVIEFTGVEAETPFEAGEKCRDEVNEKMGELAPIDSVKTSVNPQDRTRTVKLYVRLSLLYCTHADPREMVAVSFPDCRVSYGSRLLTLLSKAGWLGKNEYSDGFVENHREELRERGYRV